MKKIFLHIFLMAMCFIPFVSCEKVVDENLSVAKHAVSFTVDLGAQTKTILNGTVVEWTNDDANLFHVSENGKEALPEDISVSFKNGIATVTALFEDSNASQFTYSAYVSSLNTNGKPAVKKEQKPSATSYDPSADILIAEPIVTTNKNSALNLKFNFSRPVSINKMTLKGIHEGETIQKVTLNGDRALVGSFDPNDGFKYSATDKLLTINASSPVVYFVSSAVNGVKPTIAVTTDKATYTKTFGREIDFVANELHSFSVAFTDDNRSVADKEYQLVSNVSDLGDGDIIVLGCAANSAAAGVIGSGVYFSSVDATISDGVLKSASAVELTLGVVGDNWTISSSEGQVGAIDAKKLSLNPNADNYIGTWTISISQDKAKIASTNSSFGWLSYNVSSPRFLNYTSNQAPIEIYKLVDADVPEEPSISVQSKLELSSKSYSDEEISVSFRNVYDLDLVDVEVYKDASCTIIEDEWLTASLNSDKTKIIYTALDNDTDDSRTAYIQVFSLGENGEVEATAIVTVIQAKTVPVVLYRVTLKDDDTELVQSSSGSSVILPSRTTSVSGYSFCGWSESNITELTSTEPTIIPVGAYIPTSDINLYPVFSITSGGERWVRTNISDVTAGTYAIITNDGHAFNGSIKSGHGQVTTGTFAFDAQGVATTSPVGTIELTFAASGSGYTIKSSEGYLYATKASSGGLAWQQNESSYWYVGQTGNWTYNANSAYLRDYSNSSIRTYGTNNGDLILFAKKEGSASETKYISSPIGEPVIAKTLNAITVSGQKTSFFVDDTFSFEGVVTARYSDETTADVTANTTFEGYSMSAAGTYTVTASYTENDVTKTTFYSITVSPKSSGSVEISIDFSTTDQKPTAMPGSSAGVIKGSAETYTINGYDFVFYTPLDGSGFYWSGGSDNALNKYFYIGKTNSYIQFPVINGKKLTRVIWKTSSTCSTNLIVDVTDTNDDVIYQNSSKAGKSATYDWSLTNTAQSTAYRLHVTNAYNLQLTGLELIYE